MINEFRPMNHLTSLQNLICTIGNLPTSYALSLSYEEQIWWLCDFLENKVFPAIEENTNITEETQASFIELQNYVKDYFNNLDVQEEINNKLDEMAENGTLQTLINNFNLKSNDLDYIRLGRIIDETYYSSLDSSNGYWQMQGACLIGDDNVLISSIHHSSNTGFANNDNLTLLRKVNLATGEILSSNIVELGHCNSMAYNNKNNKIYVIPAHGFNTSSSDFYNKLIILNADTLSIENTIDLDLAYDSISIDNDNIYVGITYKGGQNANKIFKLNNNYDVEETISLNMPISNSIGTGQDFAVKDGKIYYLQSEPNQIFVFDMNGNNLQNYNIVNKKHYVIGEIENINIFSNGQILVGSNWLTSGNLFYIYNFFKMDLLHNIAENVEFRNNVNALSSVYLNNSNKNTFNPDGTQNKPFYCLDEAFALIQNNPHLSFQVVSQNNSLEYPVRNIDKVNAEFISLKLINGNSYDSINVRNSNIYFNGCYVPSVNAIVNNDLKFYNTRFTPTDGNHCYYSEKGSKCLFENCNFNLTENLTDYMIKNGHGEIIWGKNNQNPTTSSLANVTKWWDGNINFLHPQQIFYSGSGTDEPIVINNGNITPFSYFDIRCTEYGFEAIIPARNQVFTHAHVNYSADGTGNNTILEGRFNIDNGSITMDKKRYIRFNASGEMSVGESTIKIQNIYVS